MGRTWHRKNLMEEYSIKGCGPQLCERDLVDLPRVGKGLASLSLQETHFDPDTHAGFTGEPDVGPNCSRLLICGKCPLDGFQPARKII